MPLSPVSTAATLFNHSINPTPTTPRSNTPPPSLTDQYNSGSFASNNDFSFSSLMGPPFGPVSTVSSMVVSELPSTQTTTPEQSTTTPASSNTINGCQGFMGTSSNGNGYNFVRQDQSQGGRNSGLLDALLVEAETRSQKSKAVAESSLLAGVESSKGKNAAAEESIVEENRVHSPLKNSGETSTTAENQTSSSQSSIGEFFQFYLLIFFLFLALSE